MRLLGKIALGGGLASAATAAGLLAAGVLATSATIVALDPVAPPAQAKALAPFDSCEALLDWYVDNAVKDVGPYGWEGEMGYAYNGFDARTTLKDGIAAPMTTTPVSGAPMSAPGAIADQSRAVSGSATGTNTQETAVDEPDVAKTNGTLIARIENDKRLVLLDVSGAEPVVTGRLTLPAHGYESELLLAGDHVLVTQQVYDTADTADTAGSVGKSDMVYRGPGSAGTRLIDVDISDPTNPRRISGDRYTGRLLSARQYGDTVRLVTSTGRPRLSWTYPKKGVSEREASRRNRDLVRGTKLEQWLPAVTRDGKDRTPVDCADVLHPEVYSGDETVTVTTFPVDRVAERSSVSVTAGGGIVYSSTDRLYVATTAYRRAVGDVLFRRDTGPTRITTAVHAFALTDTGTDYLGSGRINGSLRDRWSLDEHDGRLRVAWTQVNDKGRTRNGITVLTERDGGLQPTATLGDLGIDEDIQSVRWFDDLAVLVTFRQIDPLYTVDLSDPDDPQLLGELKIPGYSGYLHPIGGNLLLGLGMSGDEDGLTGGAQAAVFDISNLRKPVRVSRTDLPEETYFSAVDDPRAFTWAGSARTGITPLSDWSNGTARMLALEISPSGKLETRTLATLNSEWQARSFALPDGRIAVLDERRVRLVER